MDHVPVQTTLTVDRMRVTDIESRRELSGASGGSGAEAF